MTFTKVTPIRAAGKKILVQLDAKETESKGGIIIPDAAQSKAVTGTVRSVGAQFDKAEEVHSGAKVLLKDAYAGSVVAVSDGTEVVAVEYDEILAVLG